MILRGLALLTGLSALSAHGAGFFLPNQSSQATGRGNAWVATADSPAAVHYNPAGLTQISGREIELGLYTIHLGNSADINGSHFEAKKEYQPIPRFYYAQSINDDLSVGFGFYAPFGLGTEWGNDTPFRTLTTRAELLNLRGSAVAAYKITPELSLGAGISLNYAKASLRQGLPSPTDAPNLGQAEFEGDDLAFSWIFGAHWKPHQQHAFGLTYRSRARYDLEGDFEVDGLGTFDASLAIPTPESAAIGYAYSPNDRLTIEANIEWINWDILKNFTITSPNGVLGTQPLGWKSTFVYEIGASYKINDRFTASIGYDYNENAQPDLTYTPAVADGDRHWLNAGLTYHGQNITWDFAYQYGFSTTNVTESILGSNGRYEADHHAVSISTRFNF